MSVSSSFPAFLCLVDSQLFADGRKIAVRERGRMYWSS
jgi:hypothetical protein